MIFEHRSWSDGGWFSDHLGTRNTFKSEKKRLWKTWVSRCRFWSTFRRILSCILRSKNHPFFKTSMSEGILWSSVASGMHFGLLLGSPRVDFARLLNPWRSNLIDFEANGVKFQQTLSWFNALQTLSCLTNKHIPETLNVEGLPLMIRATRSRSIYIYTYIYIYIYIYLYIYIYIYWSAPRRPNNQGKSFDVECV